MCNQMKLQFNKHSIAIIGNYSFFNTLVNRLGIEKKKKKKKNSNKKIKFNSHSAIIQNLKLDVLIGHVFAINAQQGPIGVKNEFLNL